MKRVFLQVCLLVAAGASLVGCNSLTEPTKFDVVKEKRDEPAAKQAAADELAQPPAEKVPAARPGAATQPAPNGTGKPDPEAMKKLRAAAAKVDQQRQAPQQAPGGSCGE